MWLYWKDTQKQKATKGVQKIGKKTGLRLRSPETVDGKWRQGVPMLLSRLTKSSDNFAAHLI